MLDRFLLHYLTTVKAQDLIQDHKYPSLRLSEIESIEVPLPLLPEQQRIVAILDEAFAGLAVAAANAEKNLKNARELFDSYLNSVFMQKGEGWKRFEIGQFSTVYDGPHATPKTIDTGPIFLGISALNDGVVDLENTRHVSPDDFVKWTRRVKPQFGDVVFSYETRLGQAAMIPDGLECCLGRRMGLVRLDRTKVDSQFFVYQYISKPFRKYLDSRTIRGVTVDRISIKEFPGFPMDLPTLDEQRYLVTKLEFFQCEKIRLENLFNQKIAAIAELKRSLLQKAFAGELTKTSTASTVTQFPKKIPSITTTDLHAGIIAIAYQMHEKQGKQKTFGHVKAEKIAHLVESWAAIDLDRNPVKDAAGPNDYPHLQKIQHRAKMAGYFAFKGNTDIGYSISKLRGFDGLITRSRAALGDQNEVIDKIVNLTIPMNTQQVEIFATVYAAWNNLIIDGGDINDESIVVEARENWHENKLQIPRDKFFAAIQWMRDKGFVPHGLGKRVDHRKPA